MNRIDQLLQEANDDAKPSPSDLDRVKRGLDAKLFGAGIVGTTLVAKTAVASKAAASIAPKATGMVVAWKWIGMALIGVGATGVIVDRVTSRKDTEHVAAPIPSVVLEPRASRQVPNVEQSATRTGPDAPVVNGATGEALSAVSNKQLGEAKATTNTPPAPKAARKIPHAEAVLSPGGDSSPPGIRERLAEETALVHEMGSALARGDHARAILLAEDHGRLFPNGLLKDEREAARSIAQCKMGIQNNAEIFRRYVQTVTSNTSYARVKEACLAGVP